MEYTPKLVQSRIFSADGASRYFQHKCFVFADGMVTWDFRRLAPLLLAHRVELRLCDFMSRDTSDLRELLASLSIDLDDHMPPTTRQKKAVVSATVAEYSQSVQTLSTVALLAFFFVQTNSRHRNDEKDACMNVLVAWLEELISPDAIHDYWRDVCDLDVSTLASCPAAPRRSGKCDHVRSLVPDVAFSRGTYHQKLAFLLLDLVAGVATCPTVLDLLSVALPSLAALVDKSAKEKAFVTDMLKDEVVLRGPKRSLPIDAERRAAVVEATMEGRARSTAAMALAIGGEKATTAGDFEWRHANEYMAEVWLRSASTTDISVIPDASRVGNPAKDVMVVPMSTDDGNGYHLPPQDHVIAISIVLGHCFFFFKKRQPKKTNYKNLTESHNIRQNRTKSEKI